MTESRFAYSLGAISTGYIIIPFKGEFWYVAYLIVSLVMLTLLIIGLLSYKKRPAEQLHKEERVQAPVLPILKQKPFILYTIVILLYMGSQIICSAWIPVYVESELHQGPAITGTSLTLFWFTSCAACDRLAAKWSLNTTLSSLCSNKVMRFSPVLPGTRAASLKVSLNCFSNRPYILLSFCFSRSCKP
jgi:fucose permease